MFDYINSKVTKIEQGLKSYTKYSQAKELFNRSNLDCLIYGNEIMEKQNANKN